MFSNAERCIYGKNQILETVCQYRFPTILSIDSAPPAQFQESIRDIFPRYECRREQPAPRMTLQSGQQIRMEPQSPVQNHCFTTADGTWRINLTRDFIALTTGKYTRWEDFARMLDRVLCQFIRQYQPASFDRVGLRYINAFSRNALQLEDTPWRELIAECYLGPMAAEEIRETAFSRCTQDLDMSLPGGCRLKLHAGPGLVRRGKAPADQEAKFVLDIDLSMGGNLPVNMAAGALSTLHVHAYRAFRGAITEVLHDAMEPGEE